MGYWTDIAVSYYIIKKLITPFKQWKATSLGIIDDKGKILKKKLTTHEERNAFTVLDKVILKVKLLLGEGVWTGLGLLMLLSDYKEEGQVLTEDEQTVFDQVKSILGKDINISKIISKSDESVGISWIENPDGSISFTLGWFYHKYMINSLTLSFIDKLVARSLVQSLDAIFKSRDVSHDHWTINHDKFEVSFSANEIKVNKTTDYDTTTQADLFILFQNETERNRFLEAWEEFTRSIT